MAAEGVAVVCLDRPDKGNALSADLVDRLTQAVQSALSDDAVHTLAFTGSGRHFCTGFDLSNLDALDDAALLARFVSVELLLDAVWNAPVRTVALARGRAWGAGADLFTACDLRLAAPDAQFRFPGAGFGLVLGTRRLADRVGRDLARRLTCEGAALDSMAACDAGLASAVVEDLDAALAGLSTPPVADRMTVAALRAATATAAAAHSDADLAALVRSAARPGLQQRIVRYRDGSAKKDLPARPPKA